MKSFGQRGRTDGGPVRTAELGKFEHIEETARAIRRIVLAMKSATGSHADGKSAAGDRADSKSGNVAKSDSKREAKVSAKDSAKQAKKLAKALQAFKSMLDQQKSKSAEFLHVITHRLAYWVGMAPVEPHRPWAIKIFSPKGGSPQFATQTARALSVVLSTVIVRRCILPKSRPVWICC